MSAFTNSIEFTQPIKWDTSPNLELRKGNPRVVLKETNGRHDALASLDELGQSMTSQNTVVRDQKVHNRTPTQREIPPNNSLFQSISVPVRAFCSYCQKEVMTRVVVDVEELGFLEKIWSVFSVCCRGNKRIITHFCSSCDNIVSKINAFNYG